LVPAKFLKGCDDPSIVARLDFIRRDYKFFLLACELRYDPELGEADVCLFDPAPLLRYHVEPDFPGEIDFAELLNQLHSAVCHFLGIAERDGAPEHTLYDFLTGPHWPEWLEAYDRVRTLPSALLDYMLGGREKA
jgi:hypothetical protein